MSERDFFISWSDRMPDVERRVFLGAGVALLTGTAAVGGVAGAFQKDVGPGEWAMGEIREWTGIATAEPYAMLRTSDLDGTPRTVLLGCQGKCGVSARIGALAGQAVTIKGSPIQRGRHAMIAVVDGLDWISQATGDVTGFAFPEIEPLGQMTLRGEILDSKCWFGAMRPSQGKVHKACAALCIRGGIPPAFYVKDRKDQKALLIMTDRGLGHGKELLPYVADPVSMTGEVQRWGDLLLFDGPVSALRRISAL